MTSAPARHPHIAALDDVPVDTFTSDEGFARTRRALGRAAHGRALGCSHIEVPPGASAWPFHAHCANEEAIFILEGQGLLRLGNERVPVGKDDYIALPADPDLAHQLINAGDGPLRYLCISTMISPEVGIYPDSDKIGVIAGSAPGGSPHERRLTAFYRRGDDVPYLTGERAAAPGNGDVSDR
jgi:uncharacterized cupin superfamily protein